MSKHESKPGELMTSSEGASPKINFVKEILAGLTVSFVAIILGAAFGVMSGRGALSGILSAGVIALITAILGGTRIQCSGPTAPMTAVTVGVDSEDAVADEAEAEAEEAQVCCQIDLQN